MSSNDKDPKKEIPPYIRDPNTGLTYIRGKLLGKVSLILVFKKKLLGSSVNLLMNFLNLL